MTRELEQSIKDRIKQISRAERRTFEDIWRTLIAERLLARIARSTLRDKLVFKGGICLANYIPIGRETKDLDFLSLSNKATESAIAKDFQEISKIDLADGFKFEVKRVRALRQIRQNIPGFRIGMIAQFGNTRTPQSIDLGFGDRVEVTDLTISLLQSERGPLFESNITLKAYPPEYILSEKFEGIIYRGAQNSRMKDYHDAWLLTRPVVGIDPKQARIAIEATFGNLGTEVSLIQSTDRLAELWARHVSDETIDSSLREQLPADIGPLIADLNQWLNEVFPELKQ